MPVRTLLKAGADRLKPQPAGALTVEETRTSLDAVDVVLAEAGLLAWSLTDQQVDMLTKDHLRHILAITLELADTAARWSSAMQALAGSCPLGVCVNTSSDPRLGAAEASGAELATSAADVFIESPLSEPYSTEDREAVRAARRAVGDKSGRRRAAHAQPDRPGGDRADGGRGRRGPGRAPGARVGAAARALRAPRPAARAPRSPVRPHRYPGAMLTRIELRDT
ncbi:hypothetical protein ACSJJR_07865, partial [Actinomyces sp. W5033]